MFVRHSQGLQRRERVEDVDRDRGETIEAQVPGWYQYSGNGVVTEIKQYTGVEPKKQRFACRS